MGLRNSDTKFVYLLLLFFNSILLNTDESAGQLHILGGGPGSVGSGAGFLNFAGVALNMADPCKKYLENANTTGTIYSYATIYLGIH